MRDIHLLLDPEPLDLETGLERLPSGALHVAARTDMHGCTGEMFDWWFGWFHTTQHYVWWHPGDHVSSMWHGRSPGSYVGGTNTVKERLGGADVADVHVQFHDPVELFDASALAAATAAGDVSAVVCARTSVGPEPMADADGRLIGGRLVHVARDTPFGCVLRSHFWLGEGLDELGFDAAALEALVPVAIGRGLMKHAYTEFTFLSRFLPSLFVAEHRDERPVPLPW